VLFSVLFSVARRWVGAWDQDYSFSIQYESEFCLPRTTSKKQFMSNCFAAGGYAAIMCTKLCPLCDQYLTERRVATVEILFAMSCRTWAKKWPQKRSLTV